MTELRTPVLFLIFNRPDKTRQVFQAIQQAQPKQLFIAADGPRQNNPTDQINCQLTRELVKNINWDCEVKTLFRENNLGCGKAVSSAIDWFFSQVEAGIILEDDCLPHPDFFVYCQELLDYYKNKEEVMFISGDNFQNGKQYGNASYYFSTFSHVWGWATWRRAWDQYSFKLNQIDKKSIKKILQYYFSSSLLILYWQSIFKRMQSKDPIDTWDYQLTFSIWHQRGLSIIPNSNLISNIGFDNSATHTKVPDSQHSNLATNKILPIIHPKDIVRCQKADDSFCKLLLSQISWRQIFKNFFIIK